MTFDQIQEKLNRIENDSTLQNLIAQANARYILYNTAESVDNFPKYTIKDDKLNLLAFHYLNLGCRFIENEHIKNVIKIIFNVQNNYHFKPWSSVIDQILTFSSRRMPCASTIIPPQ